MSDAQAYALEIVGGLVLVPWCAWVTTSIYAHREEIKLMKYQIKILDRIEALLSHGSSKRS